MDTDYRKSVEEEVALEGLDGITIEGLWTRLQNHPNFPFALDEKSKAFIWRYVVSVKMFTFYKLPEERPPLVIIKRTDCADPETGSFVHFETVEMYPVAIIKDKSDQGSCAFYDTRKNVSAKIRDDACKPILTLQQIEERYGRRLVVVASQEQRRLALTGPHFNPTYRLFDMDYSILERIGRARYAGELSKGSASLDAFKLSSKTLFYYTLRLIKLGLICKQTVTVRKDNNQHGVHSMYHLKRYFVKHRSKYSLLEAHVLKYLRTLPGRRQEISKTRIQCNIDLKTFKKLYQTCSKRLKVYGIKYRDFYPDATEDQAVSKKTSDDKMIRVIEAIEDSQSDEEEMEEEKIDSVRKDLTPYEFVYERSTLRQAYSAVASAGPEGLSQWDLTKVLKLDYIICRALLKNLEKTNYVKVLLKDCGRQKTKMFIADCVHSQSEAMTVFKTEKEKLKKNMIEASKKAKFHLEGKEEKASSSGVTVTGSKKKIKKTDGVKGAESTANAEDEKIFDVPKRAHHTPGKIDKAEYVYTDRQIKRMNWILEIIKEHQIIDNEYAIHKIILAKEKAEGFKFTMDRKSMARLVRILIKTNKIRSIQTVLTAGDKQKPLHLLMDMSVQADDSRVLSLIAQAQLKFISIQKEHMKGVKTEKNSPVKSDPVIPKDIPETAKASIEKIFRFRSNLKPENMVYNQHAPKEYGYRSKFMRAQSIHQVLFYLLYGYKGKTFQGGNETKGGKQNEENTVKEGKNNKEGFNNKETDWKKIVDNKGDKTEESVETIEEQDKNVEKGEDGGEKTQESEKSMDEQCTNQRNETGNEEEMDTGEEKALDPEEIKKREMEKLFEGMEAPPVYVDEYTWKRFLSPLPNHTGYGEGWCLMSDLLLKLPLCVFCRVVMIPYQIEGLKELLTDPIKSLYPVMFLPLKISQQLTFARKYIYSVNEICVVLAHMGLLTFGPQIMKEKDKVFLYLHRRAGLLDTRMSLPGNTVVTLNHPAERTIYQFITEEDLQNYWGDLRQYAFNSNLGHKNCTDPDLSGEEVEYSLKDAEVFKEVDEIQDIGRVPGNGRGGAGMDSSLFTHLYRNWTAIQKPMPTNSLYKKRVPKPPKKKVPLTINVNDFKKPENMRLPSIMPKERLTLVSAGKDKNPEVVQVKVTTEKGNKGGKGIKRKAATDIDQTAKKKKVIHNLKSDPKVKNVRKEKIRKRVFDDTDIAAFNKKKSQRVKWTPRQDSLLLICKIANLVMDKSRRGLLVSWTSVRDILHRYVPIESRDKTSCACQRRVSFSLKNSITKHNLLVFFAEAMQDPVVIPYSQREYLQGVEETVKAFNDLVHYLINKFKEGVSNKVTMPSTLSDLSKFTVTTMNINYKKTVPYQDVKSKSQILESVLQNIFHSYVSCNDKYGRAHAMYRLLNQYPDVLLDNVLKNMRQKTIIVKNKAVPDKMKPNPIETGMRNVKLSQRYSYCFNSRYPSTIHKDTYKSLKMVWDVWDQEKQLCHFKDFSHAGICAAVVAMFIKQTLQCKVVLPKDIVRLDPTQNLGRGAPASNESKNIPARRKPVEEEEEEDSDEADDTNSLLKELEATADISKAKSENKTDSDPKAEAKNEIEKRKELDNLFFTRVDAEQGKKLLEFKINPSSIISFPESVPEIDPVTDIPVSSSASRALVTMRRSKAECDLSLRYFNIQDNFVIDACSLYFGINQMKDSGSMNEHFFVSEKKIKDILFQQTKLLPSQVDMEDLWGRLDPSIAKSVQNTYKVIQNAAELGIKEMDLKTRHDSLSEMQRNLQILRREDVKR